MHLRMGRSDINNIIERLESDDYRTTFLEKRKIEEERIRKLPYITRLNLQDLEKHIPAGMAISKTSGSTGIPVIVPKTAESDFWHRITNYRELKWRKWDITDPSKLIVVILAKFKTDTTEGNIHTWKISPMNIIQSRLESLEPTYLYTYPSIVSYLDLSKIPSIIDVKTVGEPGGTNYSCEEAGTIALQCPDYTNYHIMENIIVENHPEYGAVITDLSNPYITRYIIGDKIEMDDSPCPCGRVLPIIKKIYGRVRNMLVLPNGDKIWPTVGEPLFRTLISTKIIRHQIIQKEIDILEIKICVTESLTTEERELLKNTILENLGYAHLKCYIVEVESFPDGKFEAFKSEM